MLRSVLFGLVQLVAGLAAALALYHLIGLWPAVLIVALVMLVGTVLVEALSGRTRWVETIENGRPVRRRKGD